MFTATMNFDLGEDVGASRDMVHRWAQERVKPLAAEIDASNAFPDELWKEMGDLGLLAITVPEDQGGSGMGYLAPVVAVEEIARACASVSLSYGAHSNLCVNQLRRNANPAQRAKNLPGLVSGDHVGALAMSETSAGSDVVGMKLRAEKTQRLPRVERLQILDHQRPRRRYAGGLCQDRPGGRRQGHHHLHRREKHERLLHLDPFRQARHARLEPRRAGFRRLEVPFENVLGEEGKGVRVLMSGLDYERVVLSGIGTGIMAACLDEIMPYLAERKPFGQPIGDFQLMQAKIADKYTKLNSARAYTYEVARACDRGEVTRADAAACMLHASQEAMVVAHQAVPAMGGAEFMNESPVARIFRDAKPMEIGAGTSEIRRMLIGRELMGAVA